MVICSGFAKNPLRQCSLPGNRDGYCRFHKNQCRGYKLDGYKCVARQKSGYAYCCADHDPDLSQNYVSPTVFIKENLRQNKFSDIVQQYDHKDAYHGDTLPSARGLPLGLGFELDHKFERQSAAYAVREAGIKTKGERDIVIEVLCDDVLNEDDNLCFTRKITNQIKGVAVKTLQDDLRTGHFDGRTFTSYMVAAGTTDTAVNGRTRLGREVTKAIRKEMKKANKACQYKLEDESETPSFASVNEQFKKLYVVMRD